MDKEIPKGYATWQSFRKVYAAVNPGRSIQQVSAAWAEYKEEGGAGEEKISVGRTKKKSSPKKNSPKKKSSPKKSPPKTTYVSAPQSASLTGIPLDVKRLIAHRLPKSTIGALRVAGKAGISMTKQEQERICREMLSQKEIRKTVIDNILREDIKELRFFAYKLDGSVYKLFIFTRDTWRKVLHYKETGENQVSNRVRIESTRAKIEQLLDGYDVSVPSLRELIMGRTISLEPLIVYRNAMVTRKGCNYRPGPIESRKIFQLYLFELLETFLMPFIPKGTTFETLSRISEPLTADTPEALRARNIFKLFIQYVYTIAPIVIDTVAAINVQLSKLRSYVQIALDQLNTGKDYDRVENKKLDILELESKITALKATEQSVGRDTKLADLEQKLAKSRIQLELLTKQAEEHK